MDPTIDQQEQQIKLAVSEQEQPFAAPARKAPVRPTEYAHVFVAKNADANTMGINEFKQSGRDLLVCIAGLTVTLVGDSFIERFSHIRTSSAGSVTLGIVCLVFAIMFFVSLRRCVFLAWSMAPEAVRIACLAGFNAIVVGLMLWSVGTTSAASYMGLCLMLVPLSALSFYRRFKAWRKLKAASALLIDESKEDSVQVYGDEAAPELRHELLHSARLIKTCTTSCDIMKNVGESCMKSCHRCGSTVFRPEEMQAADFQRLSKIRNTRVATNQDARTYRRADGSYVLGSCAIVATHSLPAAVLSIPFFLTGLSLAMAPGFLLPFFNHPLAKVGFVLGSIWHLLGCWLYTRTNLIAVRALILIIFSLPLLLAPMLGPAIITIWQALQAVH